MGTVSNIHLDTNYMIVHKCLLQIYAGEPAHVYTCTLYMYMVMFRGGTTW